MGSQSNMINLAVSITYKIVRCFLVGSIFQDFLKDSKDIASLQTRSRVFHSLTTEGKKELKYNCELVRIVR